MIIWTQYDYAPVQEYWKFLWLPKSRRVGNATQWCWLEWAYVRWSWYADRDGGFSITSILRLKRDVLPT